jgi:hypothetical protein
MFITASIISRIGGYYMAMPCDKIESMLGSERTLSKYPECAAFFSGLVLSQHAVVLANISGGGPEQAAAALGLNFGSSGWLSFVIHAFAVEVYVSDNAVLSQSKNPETNRP